MRQLIDESVDFAESVCWFTSLVAKGAHLAQLGQHARKSGARRIEIVDMAQGQKQSRFLAWSFMDQAQLRGWRSGFWNA